MAHETLDDRKPVNLTVNTRNGLALVVLQDGEGNILGVQRGDSVFQAVPVSHTGENRYTATVIAARDYIAVRTEYGADIEAEGR